MKGKYIMASAKIVSKNSLSIKGIITVTDNNEIMIEIEDMNIMGKFRYIKNMV